MSELDIHEIMARLPHRYPFLLVDRVLEYKEEDYLIAIKNVSMNEPFFTGHFPGRPVMPGVLMLEALAQASGVLALVNHINSYEKGDIYYFAGIDKARFKRVVEPGDQLRLEVKQLKVKGGIWKFYGEAKVGDELAVSAELMSAKRSV